MIIFLCPGQGAQKPGFLSPWLEDDALKTKLGELSEHAGVNLIKHGTVSDADTIRDTAIAQPLIVAAGLLSYSALRDEITLPTDLGVAGHSVGEFTAAAVSETLTESETMRLVQVRANAMAKAADRVATGMSAILGGDETLIVTKLAALGLEPANYNGSGQIVAAGEISALETLKLEPVPSSRVIPLQVAGAFHTRFMAPAVGQLAAEAKTISASDPQMQLWTNKDGSLVKSGNEFLNLMVGQVSAPVRWDLIMRSLSKLQITALVELTPAGTLVGMTKRALPDVPSIAIKTPDDLAKVKEMIS